MQGGAMRRLWAYTVLRAQLGMIIYQDIHAVLSPNVTRLPMIAAKAE